jgi:Immunity protein Imm1
MRAQPMNTWMLVDCMNPVDPEEPFPMVSISSENQLRGELEKYQKRRPSIIHLKSPSGETLVIGIGERIGGLKWLKNDKKEMFRIAIAKSLLVSEGVDFREQGTDTGFRPSYLLPVEEVIDAIIFFFNNHRLPEEVQWAEWNAQIKRLEIIPRG